MFNNLGTIYLTSTKDIVDNTLMTGSAKVVVLDEENPYPQYGDLITMASVLLPPYEALSAMVDGEEAIFNQIYFDYLGTLEPSKFFAVLLMCIYRGINILFYMPNDEIDFIRPLIAQFSCFGISIGMGNCPFLLDPNFESVRLAMCYFYDLMPADEYLRRLPNEQFIAPYVIPKLIQDYNPHLSDYTQEAYYNYFDQLKIRIKQSNRPLIVPFTRV